MSILDFRPKNFTLRPEQSSVLLAVEADWDKRDVFVIQAPTATGKTLIALTIGLWQAHRAHLLVPSNILLSQANQTHSELSALYKTAHYQCRVPLHPPKCKCKYQAAKDRTRNSAMGVMNYWSLMYNKLYRPVQVFDECHKVVDMLAALNAILLPQKVYGFPDRFAAAEPYDTVGDFLDWVGRHFGEGGDDNLRDAVMKMTCLGPRHLLVRTPAGLTIAPVSVTTLGRLLWPAGDVEKLVFMSATTGPMDMKELRLDKHRVGYYAAPSPIPAANRPFVYRPRYNLSFDSVPYALPVMVTAIRELLDAQPAKGIIHLPYGLALKLRERLDHPRLMYHTKQDKAAVLARFREEDPGTGSVLVASGLYEGVDLPYDAARWQLIGKVPFQSLADPVTKARAAEDPDWYAWSTIKCLLQAYGRVVRAPDDYGETFIMDTNFETLLKRDAKRSERLFPQFVLDALTMEPYAHGKK